MTVVPRRHHRHHTRCTTVSAAHRWSPHRSWRDRRRPPSPSRRHAAAAALVYSPLFDEMRRGVKARKRGKRRGAAAHGGRDGAAA